MGNAVGQVTSLCTCPVPEVKDDLQIPDLRESFGLPAVPKTERVAEVVDEQAGAVGADAVAADIEVFGMPSSDLPAAASPGEGSGGGGGGARDAAPEEGTGPAASSTAPLLTVPAKPRARVETEGVASVSAAVSDRITAEEMQHIRSQIEQDLRRTNMEQRQGELETSLQESRQMMREETALLNHRPANRYGLDATLPNFDPARHVPVLGLINPLSGAQAGTDIIAVCKGMPYYQDRIFNIIDVIKGQRRGGLMDVFRIELCRAKAEAQARGMRPRLISGGGDGTGSFAIFIVFLALKADEDRASEGMSDSGNGFIWSDEELAESFPALAQMPLGSANDFANILGWGQKYPGDKSSPSCCASRNWSARMLYQWFEAVISPQSKVVNFDLWGIMPPRGQTACDFKLAELTGRRGRCPNLKVDGKKHLHLKEAGKPVPFFVCLYFSSGFGAYMTARFQLNRQNTPLANRVQYIKQAIGMIRESTPPQLQLRLNGVQIDCEGAKYFPPRNTRGREYREVGFYNINWQAHAIHGADRASVTSRLCSSSDRQPVKFNDGKLDMFRWKFASLLKNPGTRMQTDKKKDMLLRYHPSKGQGIFFQWDGEARFAFSPTGGAFHIFIRKVMNVPVVLGPYHDPTLTGEVDNGAPVNFEFCGETAAEKEEVRRRTLQNVCGELDAELNANSEEIRSADFRLYDGREVP